MRPTPALALLLVVALSGCFTHGCRTDGGYVSWRQEGVHAELSAVPLVSMHREEARGTPVDAPEATAFLGAPPRLLHVHHAEVESARLAWNGTGPALAGYVAQQGPGPSEFRSAAEDLLSAFVDRDAARDWLDQNLPSLSRGRAFSVPVDLPLEPGPVLDGAGGPWHVDQGGAVEVEDGVLAWTLDVDSTMFHIPDNPPVEVVGTGRVVAYVREDPADLDEALVLGAEALEAYGVEARPDEATATWSTQYVCA